MRDWRLQTLKQKKQELEEKLKTNKEILRKTQMELEDKVRYWEGKKTTLANKSFSLIIIIIIIIIIILLLLLLFLRETWIFLCVS